VNPKKIKSGPGKQWMEGKDFRLAKEIKYIQHQALNTMDACHHRPAGLLFDRNRGCMDAGALLSTCCPTRPATGIQNQSTSRKPTRTTPSAGKVTTALRAAAFVYIDRQSGRIITILGYPTGEIARLG